MNRKKLSVEVPWPDELLKPRALKKWLPSRGNLVFGVLLAALLLWVQTAGALPLPGYLNMPDAPSTGTIAYQGRLADATGNPLTNAVNMEFRLYSAAVGGTPLWSELWTGANAVQASDGLFNVMLGSLTPIPQNIMTGNSSLWLGITAGTDDEMSPRVQLGSVPFAVQALTVPDGSVTSAKIASAAVTTAKIADGAVTQQKAPTLVKGPNNLTKVAHGSATVVPSSSDRTQGAINISIAGHGFSRPPTVLCSMAGGGGFQWICHTEYESATSFAIWVKRWDGSTSWNSTEVRWIAIGD